MLDCGFPAQTQSDPRACRWRTPSKGSKALSPHSREHSVYSSRIRRSRTCRENLRLAEAEVASSRSHAPAREYGFRRGAAKLRAESLHAQEFVELGQWFHLSSRSPKTA